MRQLILFFLFFFASALSCPPPAWASEPGQEFLAAHHDFFALYLAQENEVKVNYLYEPGVDSKSGSGSFDMNLYGADIEFPRPLGRDSFLILGAGFEARQYDFSGKGWSRLGVSNDTLYKISPTPGIGTFLNDDLLLIGKLNSGIYSDLQDSLSSEDFRFYGQAMLAYRFHPGTQLLLGVAQTDAYEDYPTLPLVGMRLLNDDGSVHISVTAPLEARIGLRPAPQLEFYGGYWASGAKYAASPGREDVDITVRDRRVGGGVSFWFGSHLNLVVEGGVFLNSEFDYSNNRRVEIVPNSDLETAPYISAQIGFAL